MNVIEQFNQLNEQRVSRSHLEKILQTAKQENATDIVYRISKILNKNPDAEEFELTITEFEIEPVSQNFLAGVHFEEVEEEIGGLSGLAVAVSPQQIYDMITKKMLEMMKNASGHGYKKAWRNKKNKGTYVIPYNFVSKKPYKGINFLILKRGNIYSYFENPYFLTFKQIEKLGGKLKKGSVGHEVIYYTDLYLVKKEGKTIFGTYDYDKILDFLEKNNLSSDDVRTLPILKYYNVFNGADIEGIDFKLGEAKIVSVQNEDDENPYGDSIVKHYETCPEIKHGGDDAFYHPQRDFVQVPEKDSFNTSNDYFRTLFHELAHSTGHSKRLNRDLENTFGSKKYAFEELIAEFTAVFVSAHAGIIWHKNKNHAEYLKNWSKVIGEMEKDSKFVVKAAAQAQKAADYILNFDQNGEPAFYKDFFNNEAKKKNASVENQKDTKEKTSGKQTQKADKKTPTIHKPKTHKYTPQEEDLIKHEIDNYKPVLSYYGQSQPDLRRGSNIDLGSQLEKGQQIEVAFSNERTNPHKKIYFKRYYGDDFARLSLYHLGTNFGIHQEFSLNKPKEYLQALYNLVAEDLGIRKPQKSGLGLPLTDEIRKKAFTDKGKLRKGWYYEENGLLTNGKDFYLSDNKKEREYKVIAEKLIQTEANYRGVRFQAEDLAQAKGIENDKIRNIQWKTFYEEVTKYLQKEFPSITKEDVWDIHNTTVTKDNVIYFNFSAEDRKIKAVKDFLAEFSTKEGGKYKFNKKALLINERISEFIKKQNDKLLGNTEKIRKKYGLSAPQIPFENLKQAKKYFLDWALKHLRGKKIYHKELEKWVLFNRKGIEHTLSSKISLKKMQLILQAETMLKNSHLIDFKEDYKSREEIKGAYRMQSVALLENEEVKVILTLREGENGVIYYDHKVEIENIPTPPRKATKSPQSFCGSEDILDRKNTQKFRNYQTKTTKKRFGASFNR